MFKSSILARTALTVAVMATSLSTGVLAPTLAAAQSSASGTVDVPVPPPPPPPADTGRGGDQSYDNRPYDRPAYDDSRTQDRATAQTDRDYSRQHDDYERRYAQWVHDNCEGRRAGNTFVGALLGGALGAVVGSQLGERGSRTGASLAGAGVGAFAGGAIGNSATSSSCPQGYAPARRASYDGPPQPPPPAYDDNYGPGPGYDGPPPVYYGPPAYYGYGPAYGYGPSFAFVYHGGGRHGRHGW